MARPQLCMVSPWMKDGNVMDFIGDNPSHDRLYFLMDIIDAVSYLHQMGPIVHGDLKGNNVLVGVTQNRPTAYLTDFGLSQLAEYTMHWEHMATTSATFQGNARWLAIERLDPAASGLRQSEAKSTYSDIFEMMRTFFQILTGMVPFQGKSDIGAAISAGQGQNPDRPSGYCCGLDDDTWNAMLQAWSPNRHERPSLKTIKQMVMDSIAVEELLEDEARLWDAAFSVSQTVWRKVLYNKQRTLAVRLNVSDWSYLPRGSLEVLRLFELDVDTAYIQLSGAPEESLALQSIFTAMP
ncbi:kinase-like protein [Calocera cornea HHB12733]|uniref:Kinase-like protein n=1 Tax=Calocera cornea HHB12733 TaxID=1353952 RepID=A0A165ER32_9BASI|nr:kinase-like protein [Calocera cornea HHB12733]